MIGGATILSDLFGQILIQSPTTNVYYWNGEIGGNNKTNEGLEIFHVKYFQHFHFDFVKGQFSLQLWEKKIIPDYYTMKKSGKTFLLVGYDEDDPRKKMIFVRTKHKIVIKTEKNRNFHVDFYWKTCLHLPLWLSHKNSTREQKYNEKWLRRIRLSHDFILIFNY